MIMDNSSPLNYYKCIHLHILPTHENSIFNVTCVSIKYFINNCYLYYQHFILLSDVSYLFIV